MKKRTSLLLTFVFALSLVACNKAPTEVNAEVWTVDATQKIFQDKAYDAASASKSVTVSAAKNEYEGWQVILSAAKNSVDFSYEIIAADLTSADGQNVYEAENISFFHELYMYVSPKEYYTHDGYYPDALLPMDKAVEYKENVVKAGKNQGIYAEFYIPAEQETGVYMGSFTVKLGTKTTTVPVTLEVWDYTVSEKTTAKSLFLRRRIKRYTILSLKPSRSAISRMHGCVSARTRAPLSLSV